MLGNDRLEFDSQNLFNSNKLQQYDKDGQLGFLGYLLRDEKFKIENNKIIFKGIKTEDDVEIKIDKFDTEKHIEYIKHQLSAVDNSMIVGLSEYKKRLEQTYKELYANKSSKEKDNKVR